MSAPRCAWDGCGTEPRRGQHRARLPKRLQRSVPATASMLPDEVQAYIRQALADEQAATEREADLWRRQGVLF